MRIYYGSRCPLLLPSSTLSHARALNTRRFRKVVRTEHARTKINVTQLPYKEKFNERSLPRSSTLSSSSSSSGQRECNFFLAARDFNNISSARGVQRRPETNLKVKRYIFFVCIYGNPIIGQVLNMDVVQGERFPVPFYFPLFWRVIHFCVARTENTVPLYFLSFSIHAH